MKDVPTASGRQVSAQKKAVSHAKPELPSAAIPSRHAAVEAVVFFIAVLLVYCASPVITSGDSHFVIPTALSIVRHGDANIDEYSKQFPEANWAVWKANGHYWNVYPIGVPVLALPFVWVADKTASLFGTDLEAAALERPLLGLELVIASLITAAAATALFCYLRQRISLARAVLLAGLFAFGTSAYSSASRGLWQHGPSMLLLVLAVILYERLSQRAWWRAVLLGSVAGYSYVVRPSTATVGVGFGVLVALTARSRLIPYLCGVVLVVGALLAFHVAALGTYSSVYDNMIYRAAGRVRLPFWPLVGTLFSASRGLFVFSPFLLFATFRFWPSNLRRHPLSPVEILLALLSVTGWIAASKWGLWWGGGSFGPRLLSEVVPCLTILMVPIIEDLSIDRGRGMRLLTMIFLIAGALSVAIHLRGACSLASARDWNAVPAPIDESEDRVWSWRDPQFLRGFGK